jgi:hypothetical protein
MLELGSDAGDDVPKGSEQDWADLYCLKWEIAWARGERVLADEMLEKAKAFCAKIEALPHECESKGLPITTVDAPCPERPAARSES